MILAAGLTPTWQRILRFERLQLGEVNRALEAHDCASGKGINVALALEALAAATVALAPLGGPLGQRIADEFAPKKIDADWTACAAPTRLCTTLLDAATRTTTELVEDAPPLSDAELAAFAAAFERRANQSRLPC